MKRSNFVTGIVLAVTTLAITFSSNSYADDSLRSVQQDLHREDPVNLERMTSDQFPWSVIGRVLTMTGRGKKQCTGTLVGKSLVLTAAHCVSAGGGKNYSNIIFEANYRGNAPHSSCQVTSVWAPLGWEASVENDWAILGLNCVFDLFTAATMNLKVDETGLGDVTAAGYGPWPGFQGQYAGVDTCRALKKTSESNDEYLSTITPGILTNCYYNEDSNGASGGPILQPDGEGDLIVVGIFSRVLSDKRQHWWSGAQSNAPISAFVPISKNIISTINNLQRSGW